MVKAKRQPIKKWKCHACGQKRPVEDFRTEDKTTPRANRPVGYSAVCYDCVEHRAHVMKWFKTETWFNHYIRYERAKSAWVGEVVSFDEAHLISRVSNIVIEPIVRIVRYARNVRGDFAGEGRPLVQGTIPVCLSSLYNTKVPLNVNVDDLGVHMQGTAEDLQQETRAIRDYLDGEE